MLYRHHFYVEKYSFFNAHELYVQIMSLKMTVSSLTFNQLEKRITLDQRHDDEILWIHPDKTAQTYTVENTELI